MLVFSPSKSDAALSFLCEQKSDFTAAFCRSNRRQLSSPVSASLPSRSLAFNPAFHSNTRLGELCNDNRQDP